MTAGKHPLVVGMGNLGHELQCTHTKVKIYHGRAFCLLPNTSEEPILTFFSIGQFSAVNLAMVSDLTSISTRSFQALGS